MDTTVAKTAEKVRALRKARGLYQHELAGRAGLTSQTVSNVESGRKDPETSTLRKLAKGLGVSLSELLD